MDDKILHVWTVWHPEPSKETYDEHFRIFDDKKKVYWGVIHDDDYVVAIQKKLITLPGDFPHRRQYPTPFEIGID